MSNAAHPSATTYSSGLNTHPAVSQTNSPHTSVSDSPGHCQYLFAAVQDPFSSVIARQIVATASIESSNPACVSNPSHSRSVHFPNIVHSFRGTTKLTPSVGPYSPRLVVRSQRASQLVPSSVSPAAPFPIKPTCGRSTSLLNPPTQISSFRGQISPCNSAYLCEKRSSPRTRFAAEAHLLHVPVHRSTSLSISGLLSHIPPSSYLLAYQTEPYSIIHLGFSLETQSINFCGLYCSTPEQFSCLSPPHPFQDSSTGAYTDTSLLVSPVSSLSQSVYSIESIVSEPAEESDKYESLQDQTEPLIFCGGRLISAATFSYPSPPLLFTDLNFGPRELTETSSSSTPFIREPVPLTISEPLDHIVNPLNMSTSALPPRIPGQSATTTGTVVRPTAPCTGSTSDASARVRRLDSVASRESSYSPPADRKGASTRRPNKAPVGVQPDEINAALLRKLEQAALTAATTNYGIESGYLDNDVFDSGEEDQEQDDDEIVLLLAKSAARLPAQNIADTTADHLPSSSSSAYQTPTQQLLRLLTSGSHVISLKPIKAAVPSGRKLVNSVAVQTDHVPVLCQNCKGQSHPVQAKLAHVSKSQVQPRKPESIKRIVYSGVMEVLPGLIPLSRGISLRRPRSSQTTMPATSAAQTTMRFRWPADGEIVDCVETLPDAPLPVGLLPIICDTVTASSPRFIKTVARSDGPCVSQVVICGPLATGSPDIPWKSLKPVNTSTKINGVAPITPKQTAGICADQKGQANVQKANLDEESDEESDGRRLRRHLRRTQKTQEINTAMVAAAIRQNEVDGMNEVQSSLIPTATAVPENVESVMNGTAVAVVQDTLAKPSLADGTKPGQTETEPSSVRIDEVRKRAKRWIAQRKISMQENAGAPQLGSEVTDRFYFSLFKVECFCLPRVT